MGYGKKSLMSTDRISSDEKATSCLLSLMNSHTEALMCNQMQCVEATKSRVGGMKLVQLSLIFYGYASRND